MHQEAFGDASVSERPCASTFLLAHPGYSKLQLSFKRCGFQLFSAVSRNPASGERAHEVELQAVQNGLDKPLPLPSTPVSLCVLDICVRSEYQQRPAMAVPHSLSVDPTPTTPTTTAAGSFQGHWFQSAYVQRQVHKGSDPQMAR